MLSLLVFLPLAGAALVALLPSTLSRLLALITSGAALALSAALIAQWDPAIAGPQFEERIAWVPALGLEYHLGVDGLSLPLVLLTTLMTFLAVLVSWHISLRVREYFAWLLVLETGVLGVFTSLDLLLFFLFWEVELVPMYFLIAIWGSPPPLGRREYSAIKFVVYTLFGSAFMLVGVLAVRFSAGTLDMTALAQTGIQNPLLPIPVLFWLFFIAFAVKLPMVPFHTWLPDAHTDAPTAVSVLLAGVLLKMGGYGMFRICLTLFPEAAHMYAPLLAAIAAFGVIYGAFITITQTDLKRLIAYSSVSHMGYVLLGVSALGEVGLTGAALQMFTHGTITGLLFAVVGLIYDKAHTRQIPQLQGLAYQMPFIAAMFVIAGLASLGLPSMSGFVAELLVFLGTYPVHGPATLVAAAGIVLTAGYILWTAERTLFRRPDPHFNTLTDATAIEKLPLVVLTAAILVVGLWPALLTDIFGAGIRPILERLG